MLFYDKLSDYPYGIDADYIDTETETIRTSNFAIEHPKIRG